VDSGSSREMLPLLTRFTRLLGLVMVLRDGIALAPMRERARFLLSPPIAPLLDYLQAGLRDKVLEYSRMLLEIKVHPWIAEVERLLLPAARQTPWGTHTQTLGLVQGDGKVPPREGEPASGHEPTPTYSPLGNESPAVDYPPSDMMGFWPELTIYMAQATGVPTTTGPAGLVTNTRDFRGLITVPARGSFLDTFLSVARGVKERRAALPSDLLSECESVLGYTQPVAPPPIHLHGDTWVPTIRSGAASMTAITDWPALLIQPNFALTPPYGPSQVSGGVTGLFYNAREFVTGQNGTTVGAGLEHLLRKASPPLFVTPERPQFMEGYGLQLVPPEALRPLTDTEYFGDYDAQFYPLSGDGVAAALGYLSAADLTKRAEVLAKRIRHLLTRDGDAWLPAPGLENVTHIFYSERTLQPWRVRVEVTAGIVYEQVALDPRSAPQQKANVEAVILRTLDKPQLMASTLALADALAISALQGLGATPKVGS